MTVPYNEYQSIKEAFFKEHNYDFKVGTSELDEYGVYYKTYVFEDNAIWFERMSPEFIKEAVELKFTKVDVEVKMLRTEFWNTDDSTSRYCYEKF